MMKIFSALLITLITVSTLAFAFDVKRAETEASPLSDELPVLYVSPRNVTGKQIDNIFTVDIIIANVTNLYGVDIQFAWNPTILEYVSHTKKIPVEDHPDGILHSPGIPIKDEVDETASMPGSEEGTMYWLTFASLSPAPVFNGTGTAFNMTFKVIKNGGCALEFTSLQGMELSDKNANPIEHERYDGYFESAGTPVASFNWQPTIGVVDEPVTFNASESFDPDDTVVRYYWDFDDGNETSTSNPYICHAFNHTLDYVRYYVSLVVQDNTGINSSKVTAPLKVVRFRNVGITGISLSPYCALVGTTIYVNVTVRNYGFVQENFTLTAYCNISSTEWAPINTTTGNDNPHSMNIAAGYEMPYSFAWNTTELPYTDVYYVVQVNATGVPYDDETDNTITSNPVWITEQEIHDLDVKTLTVCYGKTVCARNTTTWTYNISVSVTNQGSETENFTLITYWNGTNIIASTGVSIDFGETKIIEFSWNTTGYQIYANYTLSAYATPVAGETDTADNTYIGPTVRIAFTGDVDGDGDIEIYDVVKITAAYYAIVGNPEYKPNSDIDCNGIIDIYDVVKCTANYGYIYTP